MLHETTPHPGPSRRAKNLKICGAAGILLTLSFTATEARAQNANSLQQALEDTTFSGNIGLKNFDYLNDAHTNGANHAFAVGGNLMGHTGSFYGFSVGLDGYTGQSLGQYNVARGSSELTGTHHSLQSFRQAYLQYQNDKVEVRFGRQLIQTPWANEDYYTFNPRAFMGIAGVVNILGTGRPDADSAALGLSDSTAKLSVFAARIFNYDNRYSSSFVSSNELTDSPTNGFLTFGALYQDDFYGAHVTLQGWYYNFYGFAQLYYGEAAFTKPVTRDLSIIGGAQFVSEGNSPGDGVAQFTDGGANSVNAHIYGAKLGLASGVDSIAVFGEYSPANYNSFRHGAMLHPYTDLSITLYDDTMQVGLSDLGPGYAYGVTSNFGFLQDRLKATAEIVRYVARYGYGAANRDYDGPFGFPSSSAIPNEKFWALQTSLSYDLAAVMKGLSVEDDTDVETSENSGNAGPYANPFVSNRLYITYKF
jgi:hypothetical protein